MVFSDVSQVNANSVDHWLEQQGLSRQHMARTVNYMAAARIVEKTDAVMTLPLHMAQLFQRMLGVRIVKPPKDIPSVDMTMVHHPLFSDDPGLTWLTKHIQTFSQEISW